MKSLGSCEPDGNCHQPSKFTKSVYVPNSEFDRNRVGLHLGNTGGGAAHWARTAHRRFPDFLAPLQGLQAILRCKGVDRREVLVHIQHLANHGQQRLRLSLGTLRAPTTRSATTGRVYRLATSAGCRAQLLHRWTWAANALRMCGMRPHTHPTVGASRHTHAQLRQRCALSQRGRGWRRHGIHPFHKG